MKRLVWASLAFTTAAVVVASCVPDFQFRTLDGAGGSGGGVMEDGGTPATTGSATSGAGAGSGGGGGAGGGGSGGGMVDAGPPVVPCGTGQWHVDACAPSEFCCWHESFYSCDVCADGGTCTGPNGCGGLSNYRLLRCNGPEDCPAGQQCCEDVTQDTLCLVACSSNQRIMCGGPEHCPVDKPYCVDFATPYPGYKYCSATQP